MEINLFSSIERFVARKNAYGEIEQLVERYRKSDQVLPRGKFFIKAFHNERNDEDRPISKIQRFGDPQPIFVTDGDYGFALAINMDQEDIHKPVWCAAVTFLEGDALLSRYVWNGPPSRKEGIRDLGTDDPVILQLQSIYSNSETAYKDPEDLLCRRISGEILGRLRWEQLLTAFVVDWATAKHSSAVYILPGEMNKWVQLPKGGFPLERAKMRYNFTAKQCGFTRDENRFYKLPLQM